jgi:cytidylate kinase
MDGRDIGTVVLPDATVKIFLTATPEVRAKRRTDELVAKGQQADFEQTLKDIKQRDHQDMTRPIAPLKQADDAVLLDTSELSIEQVLAAMKKLIGEKIPL